MERNADFEGVQNISTVKYQQDRSRERERDLKRKQSDDWLTMREGHPAFGQKTPADETADDRAAAPAQ